MDGQLLSLSSSLSSTHQTLLARQVTPGKTPALAAVREHERLLDADAISDVADGSELGGGARSAADSSVVESSLMGCSSAVGSMSTGTELTHARTEPHNARCSSRASDQNLSALTAPPRYRNSGAYVHGTKFRNFKPIMERGLLARSDIFLIDEVRCDGRVPGLRDPPEILILIDEHKARHEGMEFDYDAKLGTWKTKGIDGVIRPWFFQKVVDQRKSTRGNVLFQSKQDPMMVANVIRPSLKPKKLVHATYWVNVHSIMRDGLVPAKNPTSSLRMPFRDLLQGAESHIYAVDLRQTEASEHAQEVVDQGPSKDRVDVENSCVGVVGCAAFEGKEEQPETMQEDDDVPRRLDKKILGLDRTPDAYFIIDVEKAEELGVSLDLVQSADREENIFVKGAVPPEILTKIEPNEPLGLPDDLKAQIVDPRSFESIPIIDISKDRKEVVEQLRYACEAVGFMQITGHGIPEDLIYQMGMVHKAFFALPTSVKTDFSLDAESPVRGYFGKGGEDLDKVVMKHVDKSAKRKVKDQARKDNKEVLDLNGVPWSKPTGGYVAKVFGMPSKLPNHNVLADFCRIYETYAEEMFQLCKRVLGLMAEILGHPADFFERYLTQPVATLRLIHYWPIKDFSSQIGVGEHTDYGLLTLLKQDNVGGLQVLNYKDGKWVHACPVENAFVVNLGDMLARWTGHRFKSTVHRVVNLSPEDRFSCPFFLEPNMDTMIVPGEIAGAPEDFMLPDGKEHPDGLAGRWTRRLASMGGPATAEDILERFYRASGQLKDYVENG